MRVTGRGGCAPALVLALVLAGCGGPRATRQRPPLAPPAEQAQRFADLEVAVRALAPTCTTFSGNDGRVEVCVYHDGPRVPCVASRLLDSTGAVSEHVCWYLDDRPWVVRTTRRRLVPSREEPYRVLSSETYYTAAGRVSWAGLRRDGEPIPVSPARYGWLERNEWAYARGELERALASGDGRRPGAPRPPLNPRRPAP